MSERQERWQVVVDAGTKEIVRRALEPGESLSEFVRTAVERELAKRERASRKEVAA